VPTRKDPRFNPTLSVSDQEEATRLEEAHPELVKSWDEANAETDLDVRKELLRQYVRQRREAVLEDQIKERAGR
jgi:hypothetical protein